MTWTQDLQAMASAGWGVRFETARIVVTSPAGEQFSAPWPDVAEFNDERRDTVMRALFVSTLPRCVDCGMPCPYGKDIHDSCAAFRAFEAAGHVLD